MTSPPIRLLAAGLAVLALSAACGGATGGGSGGASATLPPASTADTSPAPPGTGADPGPGARFAPQGSLLYMRTPGTGSAWAALAQVRARIPGLQSFDPSDTLGNLMRLFSAADFAEGSPAMFRSLTGESAEVLISHRTVKGEDGADAADSLFYSQVADHAGLEGWIESHSAHMGSDGGFVLYRGTGKWLGYSALSQTAWLWANSPDTLRRAIATAGGTMPSLLADRRFTAALAGVDASGAAEIGYTRGDLASELRGLWIPPSQPGTSFAGVTDRLGLADTAFAVGGNGHGIWLRAAPHVPASGYRPGPAFTPSLIGHGPAHAAIYVGFSGGATQLPVFDRVVAGILGTPGSAEQGFVEHYLRALYGVTPRDLTAVGGGEQAWFSAPTYGAAFRPADPSRAADALAAVAARYAAEGWRSGRDGDVVWLHGPVRPGNPNDAGPSPAELVAHAGISHPVSWIGAIDTASLGLGGASSGADGSASARPQSSLTGAVLSTAPGADGRYRLAIYLEIAGG